MMESQAMWKKFASRLRLTTPAVRSDISNAERSLGVIFPVDYVSFLEYSAGGEGVIGDDTYVMLWPPEDIKHFNEMYEASLYAPGLLLFGSNGGGEAFAFDLRQQQLPIVAVPFVGMSLDVVEQVAETFSVFLENGWVL
jgi:hypothetical protein